MMITKKTTFLQGVLVFLILVILVVFSFLFFPYNRQHSPFESHRFINWFVYSNIFLLLFYFFNSQYLIPKFLARKKTLLYTGIVIACLLIFLYFFTYIGFEAQETKDHIEKMRSRSIAKGTPMRVRSYWEWFFSSGPIVMFLTAFTLSSLSKIISQWFLAEERKAAIEKQNITNELTLLRSQVNPHFLFNTLNGIYSLAVTKDDKAPDAVMKLSRIMRYTLEESQTEIVDLTKEIEFIKSYIALQKLRANEKLHVAFEVKGNIDHVKIAPLLFIPFIENAFKYGVSAHSDSNIYMLIERTADRLHMQCVNDVFLNQAAKRGTGTGIANVKRRLELLYENNHELKLTQKENQYTADLFINL